MIDAVVYCTLFTLQFLDGGLALAISGDTPTFPLLSLTRFTAPLEGKSVIYEVLCSVLQHFKSLLALSAYVLRQTIAASHAQVQQLSNSCRKLLLSATLTEKCYAAIVGN